MFQDKVIGISKLKAGNPSMGCASGIIEERMEISEFSFFIINYGGIESDDEYRLELDDRFCVLTENNYKIPFSGACILSYPGLDEAVIDIVGIPNPDYENIFPQRVVI